MNDIKTAKIIKMYDLNKYDKSCNNIIKNDLVNDSFVKGKNMDNECFKNEYTKFFSRCDYEEIYKNLEKDNYWTDGAAFIGYNKVNNKISSISIGRGNPDEETKILSVKEFVDLLTNVTASKIINNPSEEQNYKNTFVKILTHLKNN